MPDVRTGTSLLARPSDDGRDRINELYDLAARALLCHSGEVVAVLAMAALDELRDTALTMHAALLREDLSPANRTGS